MSSRMGRIPREGADQARCNPDALVKSAQNSDKGEGLGLETKRGVIYFRIAERRKWQFKDKMV